MSKHREQATKDCPHCHGTGKTLDNAVVGRNCRDARLKAQRTLRETATLMGISPAYLSDLERGNRNWSRDTILSHAQAIKGH